MPNNSLLSLLAANVYLGSHASNATLVRAYYSPLPRADMAQTATLPARSRQGAPRCMKTRRSTSYQETTRAETKPCNDYISFLEDQERLSILSHPPIQPMRLQTHISPRLCTMATINSATNQSRLIITDLIVRASHRSRFIAELLGIQVNIFSPPCLLEIRIA